MGAFLLNILINRLSQFPSMAAVVFLAESCVCWSMVIGGWIVHASSLNVCWQMLNLFKLVNLRALLIKFSHLSVPSIIRIHVFERRLLVLFGFDTVCINSSWHWIIWTLIIFCVQEKRSKMTSDDDEDERLTNFLLGCNLVFVKLNRI